MVRLRHTWFVSSCLVSFALATLACSGEDGPPSFSEPTSDSGVATLSDSASSRDADTLDALADARVPFDPTDEVVTCGTDPCPIDIVAGQNHFCVLMSDQSVRCWGDDTAGALGGGTPGDAGAPSYPGDSSDAAFVPGRVADLDGVVQISAAALDTCAVLGDGSVKCWGANDVGQLGLGADAGVGDSNRHAAPAPAAVAAATRVDVGQHSACALLQGGDVWCWGANDQSQLARPSTTRVVAPSRLDISVENIHSTAAGTNTSFAIDGSGNLWSWGAVAGAEGSISGRVASSSPDLLAAELSVGPISSFAASSWAAYFPPFDGVYIPPEQGIAHACAIADGTLFCWGASLLGAMGIGITKPLVHPTAVIVDGSAYPQRVAASSENTCIRMTDGTVQCTGDNAHGQLGRGADLDSFAEFFAPAVAFDGYAARIAVADATTCALTRDGSVFCWGGNEHGELGQGTTDEDSHPAPVSIHF